MLNNPPLKDGYEYDNIAYTDRRNGFIRYTQQTAIYCEDRYTFIFSGGYEMPVTGFSHWGEGKKVTR